MLQRKYRQDQKEKDKQAKTAEQQAAN